MALILYCCEMCWNAQSEACGYADRNELRMASDGTWLCDGCWGEYDHPEGDGAPGFGAGAAMVPEFGSVEGLLERCADIANAMKRNGPVYGANEGNAQYDEACDDIASAIRGLAEEHEDMKPVCPICGRTDTHSHKIT